jgi:hypothetical protein
LLETLVELTACETKTEMLGNLVGRLFTSFLLYTLIGAAVGAGAGWFAGYLLGASEGGVVFLAVLFAIVGLALSPAARVGWILLAHLPTRGFYGLCQGFISNDPDVLTTWLHSRIERLAGRTPGGPPLTFAELARKGRDQGKEWSIQLRMMTTNLSHGQPYVFPRPAAEGLSFVFDDREFAKLFPPEVVNYLVDYDNARQAERVTKGQAGLSKRKPVVFGDPHFHFLPPGDDLPVIVATRMSLSFPVLLSAIPLFTVKPTAYGEFRMGRIESIGRPQLQRNWVSDGGISSNFPIHFFDGFLPSRPTFGMNLNYVKDGEEEETGKQMRKTANDADRKPAVCVDPDEFSQLRVDDEAAGAGELGDVTDGGNLEDVVLPGLADARYARPRWSEVKSVGGFIGAIFSTAKDYRDNMQTMLPSYRERTVQIWLRPNEGGMNLAMPAPVIDNIDRKGKRAGELCLPGKEFNMRQHQWVRLLVLFASMEPQLRRMRTNFPTLDHYRKLLCDQLASDPHWYKRREQDWCDAAEQQLDVLVNLLDKWAELDPDFGKAEADSAFFSNNPPHPIGVLRVTPNA